MESALWFLKKIQINQDWILNTDKICSFHWQNICSVGKEHYSMTATPGCQRRQKLCGCCPTYHNDGSFSNTNS